MKNILTGVAGRMELTSGFISEVFHKNSPIFFLRIPVAFNYGSNAKKKTKSDNGKISSPVIPSFHILANINLTDICSILHSINF